MAREEGSDATPAVVRSEGFVEEGEGGRKDSEFGEEARGKWKWII